MRAHRLLAVVRVSAWTAGLVLGGRLLLAAGSETLSVPLTSLDDLSVWLSETPPADMVVAVLRLAALAAVAYLLAATVLAVAAGVVRIRPLVAAADVLSPALVRRLATGGSGIGLVVGGAVAALPLPDLPVGPSGDSIALTTAPGGPVAAPTASTATMARMPDATATMTPLDTVGSSAAPTVEAEATMIRVDEAAAPSATMARLPEPGALPLVAATPASYTPTAPSGTPAALDVDPTAWVVEPGDSLWSIAEEVVTPVDGPTPTDRTVARYWQRLVAANRANLVDPDNPDLLVPGQRLDLPAPQT